MRTRSRRRLDAVLLVAGGAVTAGVAALGAAVHNEERIDQMWVGAALRADDAPADVHEVIDYNFGNATERHGLRRLIPGLTPTSPLSVYSPDGAPDAIDSMAPTSIDGEAGVEVRVGDAAVTVSGRHRYVLDYQLGTLVRGDEVAWDAVGTGWDVAVERAEIHLVAPYELEDVRCQRGGTGSEAPCDFRELAPGHVATAATGIEPGNGITIRATRGAPLAVAPTLPGGSVEGPERDGAGIAKPAALGLVGALGAAASVSGWVRRAGRERVGSGSATDAAFSDLSGTTSERLVDVTELADLATTDFAPPDDISAALGGVVHDEAVRAEHKVAWLLERAIEGTIDLEESGGKAVRLTRLAPGSGEVQEVLDTAFGGRDTISLGKYDKRFTAGWGELGSQLEAESSARGLWDPVGDRRRTVVRVLGLLAAIVGLAATGFGAAMARRYDAGWLALAIPGAVLAGGGWAALLRGWELRVRTPAGSALWLRIESFRRFLEHSEAFHAEEAAKRGVLREYTAWAVALGEIGRWQRAVEASTVIPDTAGLHYVAIAPMLHSSTSTASTPPSSSGSGGGGGGGVGGGGGGGGGGSW